MTTGKTMSWSVFRGPRSPRVIPESPRINPESSSTGGGSSPFQVDTPKPEYANGVPFDEDYLHEQARFIRDILDPQVAQNGPNALGAEDLLTLDELFRRLRSSSITRQELHYSRIHRAIYAIAGGGTRWPKRMIARCDMLLKVWEERLGSLSGLGTPLYGARGRLEGICTPVDFDREKLLVKWLRTGAKLSPAVSRKVGDLGFTPGEYGCVVVYVVHGRHIR
jgi:hypothetical protein